MITVVAVGILIEFFV